MVALTGAAGAMAAFAQLQYAGPPELFTMWVCLLGPLISGKKKRKRNADADVAGHFFLGGGRIFQTKCEFLRKTCGLSSAACKGYTDVMERSFAATDTLVVLNADEMHYSRQLSQATRAGQTDVLQDGAGFLLNDLPRRLRDQPALRAYAVDAMQHCLAKARKQ